MPSTHALDALLGRQSPTMIRKLPWLPAVSRMKTKLPSLASEALQKLAPPAFPITIAIRAREKGQCRLAPCYSKCNSRTYSICTTWERVSNADSRVGQAPDPLNQNMHLLPRPQAIDGSFVCIQEFESSPTEGLNLWSPGWLRT